MMYVITLLCGGVLGFMAAALCCVAADADRRRECLQCHRGHELAREELRRVKVDLNAYERREARRQEAERDVATALTESLVRAGTLKIH